MRTCPECGQGMAEVIDHGKPEYDTVWSCDCGAFMGEKIVMGPGVKELLPPKKEPKTHDYTRRGWGHDYTFDTKDRGLTGTMMGWGYGIEKGDYLLLQNGNDSTRYKVESISYYSDPRDMWSAKVSFAPRSTPTTQTP